MNAPSTPRPEPYRLLFVCMGNICRSPTAHGVMEHIARQSGITHLVQIDSAGTHNYHPGEPPDERSQHHAKLRGYDLSHLRARQLRSNDFDRHDLILVMDWDNLALVQQRAPAHAQTRIRRLTEFCQTHESPVVPDPYYGGSQGFEQVLDLVEDACEGLVRHVLSTPRRG